MHVWLSGCRLNRLVNLTFGECGVANAPAFSLSLSLHRDVCYFRAAVSWIEHVNYSIAVGNNRDIYFVERKFRFRASWHFNTLMRKIVFKSSSCSLQYFHEPSASITYPPQNQMEFPSYAEARRIVRTSSYISKSTLDSLARDTPMTYII